MDDVEDGNRGDGKGLANSERDEAGKRNSAWDASLLVPMDENSEGSNADLPLPSRSPKNVAHCTRVPSDSSSASSGEASFVASTRSHDNIFNIDEELGTELLDLQEKVIAHVVEEYVNRAESWGFRSRTQPVSKTASDSQTTMRVDQTNSTTGLQSSGPGRKHSRGDDDENDRRNRKRNPRPQLELSDTGSPPDPLFACPYSKADPVRYSQRNLVEMNYRGCSSRCLRDISRVKQHLYRVHRRPDHYYGSCFQEFDTQELLETHSRQRPACEVSQPPFPERMTQDQLNSIKRTKPGRDTRETWCNIFKILFPNAPLPASPYCDKVSMAAVQSFSERFRSQAPPLLSRMVRDRTQDLLLGEYEQWILENALEESLVEVIQLFEADIDDLEALMTTMSSGNPEQESNVHLTSENLRREPRGRSEVDRSFVYANVGQNSLLPSAGFRETDPQPLAIDNTSSFISAYDEMIERQPGICMSTKAVAAPNPAVTCPTNFGGTLSEKRVPFADTTIMPEPFRNDTNNPLLPNFFDDDQQQLDSLFEATYLRLNGPFEDTG